MTRRSISIRLLVVSLLVPLIARGATCPPSCAIPGGGPAAVDCAAEFASQGIRLNYPHFDPHRPRAAKEVRCFDGDPACDLDGVANNQCVFDLDVCLRNPDPALPTCTPSDVTAVTVRGPANDPDLASLQADLTALLPATTNVCTSGRTVAVPLRGPDGLGRFSRAKKRIFVAATTAGGVDHDTLRLTCIPRGWPSHGYDYRNTRATPLETRLNPANANQLVKKWDLNLQTAIGAVSTNGVTSTPTVGFGLVYVGSWDGFIVAAKQTNGALKWKYDTQSQGVGQAPGVTGSVTLTADGRALAGDSKGGVHCLDAKSGKLLWKNQVGDPAVDQIWGAPTVVGNRAYVGIASHSDQPCTHGRLVALDLDTGAVLWTRFTVPDKICHNDTTIACTSDSDCGTAGPCVDARGAGVTATVATDQTGDHIYMATVGCYTFPSVGDEDSIFKLEASDGSVDWKVRVDPPEQFDVCANDQAAYCNSSADCAFVGGGPCNPKAFYHDFGFLNGPIVVDADDGMNGTRTLVVAGSKNGTLYARDEATGAPVWTRAVVPEPVTPAFAGFGLFNGGIGFSANRFIASLFDQTPSIPNPPKHLMAFSAVDGTTDWEDEIGPSWGGVSIGGGVAIMGALSAPQVYVYDATTGVRKQTITMPETVSGGPAIVDGTVYIAYGVGGVLGGVQAYSLP
jgi:outer membrane protein assembly factor BamB